MPDHERRDEVLAALASLRARLNPNQQVTLRELEKFGWELKFIRHALFHEPLPVVFDGNGNKHAVLKPDGTLDDNPGFELRT